MNALQKFAEEHGYDEGSPRVKKLLLDAVQEQLGDKGKAVLANRFTARYNPKGVEWDVSITGMTDSPNDYIVVTLEVCPAFWDNTQNLYTLKAEYCDSNDRTLDSVQAPDGDYDVMQLIQSCINFVEGSRKRKGESKLKIRVHERHA